MRHAGVIGDPIAHSKSPLIHGYWLERLRLAGDYTAVRVLADDLPAYLDRLRVSGWSGVNVTVPHKVAVAALCDRSTEVAAQVGAVNTVIVEAGGLLCGHNTDVTGFTEPLRSANWAGTKVCVLGAGGAARAVVAGLAALGVGSIHVVNRTKDKIAELPAAVVGHDWSDMAAALDGARLLVNTTVLGMTGQPPLSIDLAPLAPEAWVNDIVYAPLETALIAQARARNHRVIDGLEMLIGQAAEAFSCFYGSAPPRDPASDLALRQRLLS